MKGQTITPEMSVINLSEGHTARAAKFICQAVGGDLFEIEADKVYPEDHFAMIREAKHELDNNIHVPVKKYPENFGSYDTIFLGYPNWYNTLPMPVVTFLENLDWSGKKIIPFNTSEGSGLGHSIERIRKICKGADVDNGKGFRGSEVDKSEQEIISWAKSKVAA